ncbi:MAG TPA: lysylphosphatidylglycerol synthase transmembrane domain-containing protein [Solirubrobacteraceae bacterium]|nr:lysylphosphatidylglycerol synthase transmembrane domain-containing protein [Solirubrobacteraceae bacterium]
MRALRHHPMMGSVVAVVVAAVAVVIIARVTGADAIGRAFQHVRLPWIALVAGAELLTYPAYTWAYRSIACVNGRAPLSLPVVARLVVAGFGPFALGGGFGIDKQALHALHEDERGARVLVMGLGTLEWAVLAPIACIVSIAFLATGANIMPSLLWPWAVAVPLGFGFAFWASARSERLARIGGRRRDWLAQGLEGVGVLHTLVREPRAYRGAWLGTAAYWGADIIAFYGALRIFGLDPNPGKVIIAYGTGYAATRRSLPLGGAGVTEALMTYALYWVREPLAPALAAVLVYRAFNFLLVAAPAVIAHRQLQPFLHHGGSRRAQPKRARRENP